LTLVVAAISIATTAITTVNTVTLVTTITTLLLLATDTAYGHAMDVPLICHRYATVVLQITMDVPWMCHASDMPCYGRAALRICHAFDVRHM